MADVVEVSAEKRTAASPHVSDRPNNAGSLFTRNVKRLPALFLGALAVIVYAGVWSYGFVNFDDPRYIIENPHVASSLSWANVGWAFTTGYAANWHPITWLSHMLDVTLAGPTPAVAHVNNLVLHAANTVLLFTFLRRTTGALGPSAVVAALFAAHPLHVESVAWISERKDVLSTFFGLIAMLAYVAQVRSPSRARAAVLYSAFALGLMAKPMLVTLPLVLLAIDRWPINRPMTISLVREKLPLFLLSGAAMVITLVVQRAGGAVAPFNPYPIAARLAHAATAYADYLRLTVWPVNLAVFYPLPIGTGTARLLLSLAAIAAITIAAVLLRQHRPYLLTGWLWYIVMLVPVIGIVQVGGQGMADRYTYFSLVGVFMAIVWLAWDLAGNSSVGRAGLAAVAAAAIVACGLVAHHQLQFWRSSLALWTRALDVTTDNYRARNAVGALLIDQGRLDEAIVDLREAVRLEPAYADAHNNLGAALARHDQIDDAIVEYREALRLAPDLALAHNNLGIALARTGSIDTAIAELRAAARLSPNRPDFHYNLAVLLVRRDDRAGAIAELDAAVRAQPGYEPAVRLRAQLGR
jgi:Flp pilus assembly protein TadD